MTAKEVDGLASRLQLEEEHDDFLESIGSTLE